jgi:hypothetical protein
MSEPTSAAPPSPARVLVHAVKGEEGGKPEKPPRIRPRPRSEKELGWTPRPMVSWLDPRQLSATAVRAVLSDIFGAYADRREVQAALALSQAQAGGESITGDLFFDYSAEAPGPEDGGGFWLDYAADLGDGFDATYTLASFLGAESLRLDGAPAAGSKARASREPGAGGLPRGRFLVMGGDQVYPTASRDEYANRLAGPFEAALPGCMDEERAPRLYAIPGNHDWYDGLTAFSRLFAQGRWIGGWKTEQKRSYFAARLPNRWWLLGTDVQLHSDIDKPQLDYFCQVARHMERGDRVILCTAEPAWCYTKKHEDAFDNLAFFESTVLRPAGAELALTLTGDLHHYARYQDAPAGGAPTRHKITAGGGGAYLLGTGWLPGTVTLPQAWDADDVTRDTEPFHLVESYPDRAKSRALRWGALRLPWDNHSFACFLGSSYAAFAWFLQSASMTRTYELEEKVRAMNALRPPDGSVSAAQVQARLDSLMAAVQDAGGNYMRAAAATPFDLAHFGGRFRYFWDVLLHSPTLMVFTLLFVVGMIAFCTPDPGTPRGLQRWVKIGAGGLHGAAHVMMMLLLTWGFARFNGQWLAPWLGSDVNQWPQVLVFVAEMFLLGGGIAATLFSLFLLPGLNYNEAFSAQHLKGYKNFLRLRIDRETGELRVYPFGVDRAGTWKFDAQEDTPASRLRPYFRAAGAEPVARLIEDPIVIRGARPGTAAIG